MAQTKEQVKVLVEFGYLTGTVDLEGNVDQVFSDEQVVEATKNLQVFYGLPTTGEWDEMTSRTVTRTPRCGCVDVGLAREVMDKWGALDLRYFIESHVDGVGLSKAAVEGVIREAFNGWSAVCGLQFKQIASRDMAHIVMTKGRGRRAGFDGPSGTLAYAYLPQGNNYQGQLELVYDMDEPWSIGGTGGTIDLLAVTAHEIGHTLGLDHSQTPDQLMNPFYNIRIRAPKAEDASRVVSRYGPPRTVPVPAPPAGGTAVPVSKLEILLRLNGNVVIGPQEIDLTKRALIDGAVTL